MEKYIKYTRFQFKLNGNEAIQKALDEVSSAGWDIIYYNEVIESVDILAITIIGGKKQSTIL